MEYKVYADTEYDEKFVARTINKEDAHYLYQMLIESGHWDYVAVYETDEQYELMEDWANDQ